ncbi:TonB-dependent receptor [Methylopila sp. Yamaguchi]|uniref:TonB-dependent receptor n=1 Tax=Methylopila sp. Yamaguchi TaxID=1437817 RepID=UPI001FCE564B|nr:TonB-dependent receptor [Methylopila sp. Yamaguchi]
MSVITNVARFGGVSALAVGLSLTSTARADDGRRFTLDIPSKPLLAALADYTAATGVQLVRTGGDRIAGRSRAVSGRFGAEEGLRAMLAGSGLIYQFTGPRTAALYPIGGAMPVQLAGEAEALDELQVTGESGAGAPGGAPGSFVVTSADIERKNPQDVRDLFGGEPGVQVGSSIPLSQKVYVRGVEETNLAVTIDGSAQNNKVFHHNATTYIDPGLLKQARVDPGVAPADAGFGALAGSIAYETKDVPDLLGHDRDGYGGIVKGTFNSNGAVFGNSYTVYGKQNGFEALGYFNWADGGRYRAGENGPRLPTQAGRPERPDLRGEKIPGTATDLLSGLAKLAYESSEGHRFEVSHERVHDDTSRPFRANAGDIIAGAGNPLTRNYKLDRQNTVLNYSTTSPEGWFDPKVVLAYSETKVKIPNFSVLDEIGHSTGSTSSLNGRAENRFALPLGSVTAGVDFRHDVAKVDYGLNERGLSDPVLAAGYLDARERMTNIGLYAQARLEPIERARLNFGGRADHQRFKGTNDDPGSDISHSGLSGNVSGEYDLVPDLLTAKAGYSHVWAGVPLAENFIMNRNWDYSGETGKDLNATTADNYSAGLVIRHSGFAIEGSIFKTQIENARNAKFSNTYDFDGRFVNFYLPVPGASWAPDLDTKGFEIGAGYEWETGFVRVKYAHIDVDINGRPGDSDTGNYIATPVGDVITISAAHTFAAWNVTVGGDIEIAPKYKRTGYDPFSATLENPRGDKYPAYPAYEIVNAFIEYKPKLKYETTFRLDVKNIFDEAYSSRATYGDEFGNVTPLYEPGRSFLMTAQVKF